MTVLENQLLPKKNDHRPNATKARPQSCLQSYEILLAGEGQEKSKSHGRCM